MSIEFKVLVASPLNRLHPKYASSKIKSLFSEEVKIDFAGWTKHIQRSRKLVTCTQLNSGSIGAWLARILVDLPCRSFVPVAVDAPNYVVGLLSFNILSFLWCNSLRLVIHSFRSGSVLLARFTDCSHLFWGSSNGSSKPCLWLGVNCNSEYTSLLYICRKCWLLALWSGSLPGWWCSSGLLIVVTTWANLLIWNSGHTWHRSPYPQEIDTKVCLAEEILAEIL